jgi:hypothetical protein
VTVAVVVLIVGVLLILGALAVFLVVYHDLPFRISGP